MQLKIYLILHIFLHFNAQTTFSNDSAELILYTLCGCPFGYYEVSRFPLSTLEPPKCIGKENIPKSRSSLEGYQCQRCHQSCHGCHGPTNGDCSQCGINYLKARIYGQRNGNVTELEDDEIKRKTRNVVEEDFFQQQNGDLMEFASDLNEDHLMPVTRQIREGEYDLGSGSELTVEESGRQDASSTGTISVPREDRSTGTSVFEEGEISKESTSTKEEDSSLRSTATTTTTLVDIYEEVIYTNSPTITTTKNPPTKSTPKLTTTSNLLSTNIYSENLISRVFTTFPSTPTTNIFTNTTTTRIRKPKTRKHHTRTSTTTPLSPPPPTTTTEPSIMDELTSDPPLPTNDFWCVSTCPDGSYPDYELKTCHPCDSKCQACLGPSFMNCTTCTASAVQVSAVRRSSRGLKTITCLSNCPLNEFANNGTCTPCHGFCDGCTGSGLNECLRCKYGDDDDKASTKTDVCHGPKEDPPSLLEIILPLVFVLFLIVFTIVICLRWNGLKAVRGLPLTYKLCRCSVDKENEQNSLEKKFPMKKARNEYTSSPPSTKFCPSVTDDGYELPVHPQPGPSGFSNSGMNNSSIRSIKPRRNDPLPPTPLEMRSAQRKNSYLYDYYVNQPPQLNNQLQNKPEKPIENEETQTKKMATTGLNRSSSSVNQYANSDRLYANC